MKPQTNSRKKENENNAKDREFKFANINDHVFVS
jgi:hypothetical protein